jgi:hypothetical protein
MFQRDRGIGERETMVRQANTPARKKTVGGTEATPRVQRVIAVLWPSFLVAGLATVLFFLAFDPRDLVEAGIIPEISRLGAYTIGFFLFWLTTASACLLTCYFQRPCPR